MSIPKFEGTFADTKLTSKRCDFCHEFLIEGEDDLNHLICKQCWKTINEKFIISKIK